MNLAPTLTIRRWNANPEPHRVDAHYAERFWLPVIGPSGLWLLRWASRELIARGGAFDMTPDEMALRLGLGRGTARHSPMRRSLMRLETFELARRPDETVVEFRSTVPVVSMRQLERMPVALRREHRAWLATAEQRSARQQPVSLLGS